MKSKLSKILFAIWLICAIITGVVGVIYLNPEPNQIEEEK